MKKITFLIAILMAGTVFSQNTTQKPAQQNHNPIALSNQYKHLSSQAVDNATRTPSGHIRCLSAESELIKSQLNLNYQTEQEFENWINVKIDELANNPNQSKKATRNIPVVFHVLYSNSTENVSNAQVLDQLRIMNEDFSATNADFSNVPAAFNAATGSMDIQFCLAVTDPLGNPTNGIDRISIPSSPISDTDVETNYGLNNMWDATKYLNVFVGNISGGLLGKAVFPTGSGLAGMPGGGAPAYDGVMVGYTAFGSIGTAQAPYNLGRSATHEIGHWLGLRHIWGDANCGDDFCNDTPTQQGSNFGCPTYPQSNCSSSNMFMNYMDYVDDACMYTFSNDQKLRMDAVLQNSPQRVELLTSTACVPASSDDAGISTIVDPQGIVCGSTSFIPTITITNYGSSNLTSATVNYYIDANTPIVYNWTGNLTTGSTDNIVLPSMSTTVGTHTFTATTALPNGNADGNAANDQIVSNFSIAFGTEVELTLNTDCWGYEVYWELEDGTPSVLYSSGNNVIPPGGAGTATGTDPGALASQVTITENWCLADGCYDFTIYDDYGDGLAGVASGCAIDGSYSINEVISGANLGSIITVNFGNSETQNFCISSCTTDAGTMSTTPLSLCGSGAQTATANGDETLDGNDVIEFYIHDNAGTTLGTSFGTNGIPVFSYGGSLVYGTAYYISTVTGNNDGSGNVDLTDPCLSVSAGTPVVWYNNVIPIFTQAGPYCVGDTPATLATTSNNGVIGTWNSAISTASAGSVTYIFTETGGCNNTTTMDVVVNSNVTPTFTQVGPYCVGDAPATLPTTSNNGATGTWNTAISTASAGTITYSFTPSGGCFTSEIMMVVVNANVTPTFTQVGPYCIGDTPGTLPTTSDNGVTGTWNAAISTASAGTITYSFTPSAGCFTTAFMMIAVNANITPTFTQVGPYCIGDTPATLPTTSDNGVIGIWNAAISTASAGTITYSFTPGGGCGASTTMDILVNANVIPIFTQVGPYCEGDIPATLPTTSDNGVLGTWNAAISTASAGTITYSFTPSAGCFTTANMIVTVNANVTPIFTQVGPYCVGDTPATLSTTSTNGVSGTWNAAISTTSAGTITYSFTPSSGCFTTAIMIVTVNANITPTFMQVGPYCEGDTPATLPTTSDNGISGTWDATISTASAGITTYTFTPSGSCETVATMDVLVNLCTGIDNISAVSELNIFPNPAHNLLNVVGLENVKQVSLLDVTGKTLYSNTKVTNNKLSINLSNFSNGMYFLKVQTESNIESFKVIKH
jgi:hypothetical protein